MSKLNSQNTASISFSDWKKTDNLPNLAITSSTKYALSSQTVLIQGRFINSDAGVKQIMVSLDPIAIERKLAIRELNDQLEGKSVVSQTYSESV